MPVISISEMFLDRAVTGTRWVTIRVEANTGPTITAELLARFPQLRLKHPEAAKPHEIRWFGLWRDDGNDDLRYEPDVLIGEDEVVHFVNQLGC